MYDILFLEGNRLGKYQILETIFPQKVQLLFSRVKLKYDSISSSAIGTASTKER